MRGTQNRNHHIPIWAWVKIPIVFPVNISIPTKIGSKMGGEFTYPKMGSQNGFDPPQLYGPIHPPLPSAPAPRQPPPAAGALLLRASEAPAAL